MLDSEHGMALEPLGRMPEAEVLLRSSRDQLIREFGATSSKALRARGNFASVLLMQGKWADGIVELEALLPDMREHLGAQHPNLAMTMGNLAVAYQETGRSDDALTLRNEITGILVANYGDEHTDVARHRLGLAESYLAREQFQLAFEQAQLADQVFAAALGTDHAWRLVAVRMMAVTTQRMGDSAAALAMLDEVIAQADVEALQPYQQAGLWTTRARFLALLKRSGEARIDLERAHALMPQLGGWAESAQIEFDEVSALIE